MIELFKVIFFSVILLTAEARVARYSTTAPSVALVNAKTGGLVYEKNGDKKRFPGSTIKIATAATIVSGGYDLGKKLMAHKHLVGVYPSKERLKILDKIPYALERNGTHMSIAVGEVLSVRDLLHGLMIVSANDAANILAEGLEGSVEEFLRKMALFIEKAGCTNTQFVNPHGLFHPEHYSTAKDMALILTAAMKEPLFRELIAKQKYQVAKTNKSDVRYLIPSNRLIKKGKYSYAKSLGGKTGQHTVALGKNLVSAAADRGLELAIAVLDCKTYIECYEQTALLAETAFARGKERREFLKAGYQPFKKKVRGSSTMLETWTQKSIALDLFRGEQLAVEKKVIWHTVQLPLKKGDVVGRVAIFNKQGVLLASEPLLARIDIAADLIHKVALHSSGVWRVLSAHTNLPGMMALGLMGSGAIWRLARRSKQRNRRR